MHHRDHDTRTGQRRWGDRVERAPGLDERTGADAQRYREHHADSRDDRDSGRAPSSGYASVRQPPGRHSPDPPGLGPAGYAPREREQEFMPAWDERNQASYGRTYGSGSREGSYGRGMQPGSYRGRGPRGFVRSDSRISEELNEWLTDDDGVDASDISVSVQQGVATLEGHVPERWMKHRAEDLAAHCGGVTDVVNRLRVRREGVSRE